jgi:hypothetical protein
LERGGLVQDSKINSPMSALGHKRTWHRPTVMSALPPKADIRQRDLDVRFVPKADIDCITYSITSSPIASIWGEMKRTSGLAIDSQVKLCRFQHGNILRMLATKQVRSK